MQSIDSVFPQFFDLDGSPLDAGSVWFGVVGLNPVTSPAVVYWDEAGTQPAAQPVRTLGGYLSRSGAPAQLYTASPYSMLIRNRVGALVGSGSRQLPDSLDATFLQGGTGAVLQSVRTKLRERATPEDFGGSTDGVTDATSSITKLLAYARNWLPTALGAYLASSITLKSNLLIAGVPFLGKLANTENFRTVADTSNIKLIGVDLDALGGTGYNCNTANVRDVIISASRIKTPGYGVLTNLNAIGADGLIVSSNFINSDKADGIELNNPVGTTYNAALVGNIIDGGPNHTSTSAGFGVGVAGTDGHITLGNHVRASKNESYHFEDKQKRGIMGFNTAQASGGNGVQILYKVGALPMVVVGNWLKRGGAAGGVGINFVSDANGVSPFNVVAHNIVSGFSSGIVSDGSGVIQAAGINLVLDAAIAIEARDNVWLGMTYARGCTDLAKGGGLAIIGKVVSLTQVMTPLIRAGTTGHGPYMKGLLMNFPVAHTGGAGLENFDILTLPTRMAGRITVTCSNGTNGLFYSAELVWDGATLTLSNAVTRAVGVISTVSLINNAGNLALRFFAAAPVNSTGAKVDFDGVFHIA